MHSAVYADLVIQGFAQDVTIKEGTQEDSPFARYFLGKPVLIDDSLPTGNNAGGVFYHTYLCGTGLIMTAQLELTFLMLQHMMLRQR